MTIIKNAEIWFSKLDPKRPNKKLTPKNPTWEVQIRTKDKEFRKLLTDMNIKLKAVREDPTDEESPVLYYKCNLKKRSLKIENGTATPAPPVQVVNGRGADLDPNTIGNGSIANLRVVQNPFSFKGEDGNVLEGISTTLMAVQVTKHVVYTAKPMEEFEDCETETVVPAAKETEADDQY